MKRDNFSPSKNSFLCSEHFLDADFNYSSNLPHSESLMKRYLKKDAIPSVFQFPSHIQKKAIKERNPKKRESQPVNTEALSDIPAPKTPRLDHTYASKKSPKKLNKEFIAKIKKKNLIIHNLRRKNLRKERTIKGLMTLLENAKLLSKESSTTLINNFGHMTACLFKNELENNKAASGSRYATDIKEFAVSLHFYSPKAYRLLRKYLSLPHPSTIRAWSARISCEPGFLKKPLLCIADLVKDGEKDFVIIIDEMSIKKETTWDQKSQQFVGTVDYGTIKAEDPDSIATNVLLILTASLKKPSHIPMAYFLTNKLNSDILCQIINESIKMLHEVGANVHAVIFDGASKNVGMAEKLGCNIKNLDGSFPHPCEAGKSIHVIFDICHMIKLARNAFSDMKVISTACNEKICWEYILALYRTQQKDILHLGNKLKAKHVKWQNHKMKVNVATQLFSHSVAAAITFLRNIKLKGFENSKPTSDFILLMNDLFDVLNSKSKYGKHRKQPINSNNFNDIQTILCDTVAFLKCLKDTNDLPLIQGPRKTFLIGFCVSSHSILTISKNLLEREESPFEYILTYRFSQDAIEMFFSKIRSRFGWNNNPTALQFKYALRSLLLKNKIESPSTANCVLLSDQENSPTSSGKIDPFVSHLLLSSNVWRADVLYYISGYVAKKLLESIHCPECVAAFYDNSGTSVGHDYLNSKSLLSCKRYGNLISPSDSLYRVVTCVDKLARKSLCKWSSFTNQDKLAITMSVLEETRNTLFPSIQDHSKENHILDSEMRDDHITVIIKEIVNHYLKLFFHQFSRVYTERVIKRNLPSRRNKLTKTILFYNE